MPSDLLIRSHVVEATRAPRPAGGLVSIGYEGRTADDLVRDLVRAQVTTLADVRLTPISRKAGLSKTRLAARLREAGIDYVHLKALGNPKENRAGFADERIEQALARYRDLIDANGQAREQLRELADRARRGRVAVLCFERDVARCHRQAVLAALTDQVPTVTML